MPLSSSKEANKEIDTLKRLIMPQEAYWFEHHRVEAGHINIDFDVSLKFVVHGKSTRKWK